MLELFRGIVWYITPRNFTSVLRVSVSVAKFLYSCTLTTNSLPSRTGPWIGTNSSFGGLYDLSINVQWTSWIINFDGIRMNLSFVFITFVLWQTNSLPGRTGPFIWDEQPFWGILWSFHKWSVDLMTWFNDLWIVCHIVVDKKQVLYFYTFVLLTNSQFAG